MRVAHTVHSIVVGHSSWGDGHDGFGCWLWWSQYWSCVMVMLVAGHGGVVHEGMFVVCYGGNGHK